MQESQNKENPKRSIKAIILFAAVFFSLAFDQWTKHWAVESLKGTPGYKYLGGTIRLIYAENRGAWGNLGGQWPDSLRFSFLIVLPCLVLLGLAVYIIINQKIKIIEITSLSLIVAGGIGNLIDRIRYDYVVDMFWTGIPGTFFQTNIFNIADVVIMIGFCTLFLLNFINWLEERKLAKRDEKQT